MVIFAVTRSGYTELEQIIRSALYPVWVGDGVLNEQEIDSLRSSDIDLTNFNYAIDPSDDSALDEALATIAEHHPNERVWLECLP
ncbi:hypothetical protein P3339_06185 [Microbulbifer sp. MLAF003]|uniref:hypothetical protein n=1 Tax=unclassified Microbulbifer TaxID=2619833 RepID=UPI0024AD451A|nr:hypothetical protein [Microbulbifer sp. MLAF003]WHI52368.1 hypothetical protein P3339_06185 [Microbulbifer sp. MLAF003]